MLLALINYFLITGVDRTDAKGTDSTDATGVDIIQKSTQ
jgi:hypothetical protein